MWEIKIKDLNVKWCAADWEDDDSDEFLKQHYKHFVVNGWDCMVYLRKKGYGSKYTMQITPAKYNGNKYIWEVDTDQGSNWPYVEFRNHSREIEMDEDADRIRLHVGAMLGIEYFIKHNEWTKNL